MSSQLGGVRGSRQRHEADAAVLAATMRDGTIAPTMADVTACFDLPIDRAAKQLGVGQTWLKHICRENGVVRWPYRKLLSLQNSAERLRDSVKHIDPRVTDNREKLGHWEMVQRQIDQLTAAQAAIRGGQCAEKITELYAQDALKAAARCGRTAKTAAKSAAKANLFHTAPKPQGYPLQHQQTASMHKQSLSAPPSVDHTRQAPSSLLIDSADDRRSGGQLKRQPSPHGRRMPTAAMPADSGVTSFADASGGYSHREAPGAGPYGQDPSKRMRRDEDCVSTAESPSQPSKIRIHQPESLGAFLPGLGSPAQLGRIGSTLDMLTPTSPPWLSSPLPEHTASAQTYTSRCAASRSLFETPPSSRVQSAGLRPPPMSFALSSPRAPQEDIFATLQEWNTQRLEAMPPPQPFFLSESFPAPPTRHGRQPDGNLSSGRWTFGGSDGH